MVQLTQQRALEPGHIPEQEQKGPSKNGRKPLNICFQCGMDSYKMWTCKNVFNPALVVKFEEVKRQRQENYQGSG